MAMARAQTMVQLSDTLIVLLDQEAGRRGISRSALIRDLLEESLRDEREAEIDRQIIEGYTRMPPGSPDEWGDRGRETDDGLRDLFARLDVEERDAGFEAW
jgi:hypothetical protein